MADVAALKGERAYAIDGRGTLYWNLLMEGEATVDGVRVVCKTAYPWCGKAVLTVGGQQAYDNKGDRRVLTAQPLNRLTLKIRIPGWARGRSVPSDLYAQTVPTPPERVGCRICGGCGKIVDANLQ